MSFTLDYTNSVLNRGLDKMSQKVGTVVLIYAATKAATIEAKMKQDRVWTDRTGLAKTMLKASVSQVNSSKVRITLSHGVWYGFALEFGRQKRYAIIAPTIYSESRMLINDMRDIMSRLELSL